MEQFSDIFNKLQSVIQAVGHDINFPQIVVMGSQSDGKSSVLEGIVKNGFLPRGSGIVTRTPIILQLKNDQKGFASDYIEISYDGGKEGRIVEKVISCEVSSEIQKATEKLAGTKKNIVDKPITVKICSANVPDLTLVDLPGLVENPAYDQPTDIKTQVERLVRLYVTNPNAIILAVHPATSDLANSKSLHMARKVDPEGRRTICVITKLDLVNANVTLLNGTDIAMHHTKVLKVIGVINRSQAQADDPKWTNEQQEMEEEIYFKKYKKISSEHGMRVLIDYLKMVFREHIKKCIPELKTAIDEHIAQNKKDIEALGKFVQSKNEINGLPHDPSLPDPQYQLVVKIVTEFCQFFRESLDGNVDQGSKEIRGGAKLEELFNTTYWNALGQIVPMDKVSESDAWNQIRNSWGTERQMFLSIKAFGILVRIEMQRMKEESTRCVMLAHKELLTIRDFAGKTIENFREQFPNLFNRINEIVEDFLGQKLEKTLKMVDHCVSMQLDYINVKHPDFDAARYNAAKRFGEIASILAMEKDATNVEFVGDGNVNTSTEITIANSKSAGNETIRNNGVSIKVPSGNGNTPNNLITNNKATAGKEPPPIPTRITRQIIQNKPADSTPENNDDDEENYLILEDNGKKMSNGELPPKQNAPFIIEDTNKTPTIIMAKQEKLECEITVELARKYFDVIRCIVRDSVPKVVMRFMVNEIKGELLASLTTPNVYEHLLKESEILSSKRRNLQDKLVKHQEAAKLVYELYSI